MIFTHKIINYSQTYIYCSLAVQLYIYTFNKFDFSLYDG